KGYWVALADVSDPEGYKLYVAENAKAFRKYHGRFLTRGGQSETPERTTRSRVVVIEFPDYKAALDCYRSPEYAKAGTRCVTRGDMRGMKNPHRSHRPLNFSGAAADHCKPFAVAAFRHWLARGIRANPRLLARSVRAYNTRSWWRPNTNKPRKN